MPLIRGIVFNRQRVILYIKIQVRMQEIIRSSTGNCYLSAKQRESSLPGHLIHSDACMIEGRIAKIGGLLVLDKMQLKKKYLLTLLLITK